MRWLSVCCKPWEKNPKGHSSSSAETSPSCGETSKTATGISCAFKSRASRCPRPNAHTIAIEALSNKSTSCCSLSPPSDQPLFGEGHNNLGFFEGGKRFDLLSQSARPRVHFDHHVVDGDPHRMPILEALLH